MLRWHSSDLGSAPYLPVYMTPPPLPSPSPFRRTLPHPAPPPAHRSTPRPNTLYTIVPYLTSSYLTCAWQATKGHVRKCSFPRPFSPSSLDSQKREAGFGARGQRSEDSRQSSGSSRYRRWRFWRLQRNGLSQSRAVARLAPGYPPHPAQPRPSRPVQQDFQRCRAPCEMTAVKPAWRGVALRYHIRTPPHPGHKHTPVPNCQLREQVIKRNSVLKLLSRRVQRPRLNALKKLYLYDSRLLAS